MFGSLNPKNIILAVWAVPLGLGLSLLLGLHFAAQNPEPLKNFATSDSLTAHHFLSLRCTCSKNLIKHLLERKASAQIPEVVHLIFATPEIQTQLETAGYKVLPIGEEDAVKKFNLQSLPQFVISENGHDLYQGGYGRDQQHSQVYEDQKIIEETIRHKEVAAFPIFGCANGHLRQTMFDILGVKYVSNE